MGRPRHLHRGSGIPAPLAGRDWRRRMATLQIGYLHWITTSHAEFYRELTIWTIVIFTLLANLGGFAYLLDDETDKNHPFRLWVRPFGRRLLMLVMAPSRATCCRAWRARRGWAPVRASTRDDVIKWGILHDDRADAGVLWLMKEMHTGAAALLRRHADDHSR